MKKVFACILLIAICILTASCNNDVSFSDVVKNPDITEAEFALYSGDLSIALNTDITNFKKEPIKVKDGSGDGFSWSEYEYYDITVKALKTDDGTTNVIKITTSSSDYVTSKGIKVGDNTELLKERYDEYLYYQENIDNGDYYLYDPENDLGFKKIRFYVEDEIIKTIEMEDTIDG
jgi:hypothetical protein